MPLRVLLLMCLLLAACQPAAQDNDALPTLAALPTGMPAAESSDTPPPTDPPASPTSAPAHSATPVPPSPSPAATQSPTQTQPPTTLPPSWTPPPGQEARIVTLTPGGVQDAPQAVADLIITEGEFQAELTRLIAPVEAIQSAQVRFVPQGMEVQLTALGGQAFTSGLVLVAFDVAGGFAQISIADIQMNAIDPPEAFIQVIGGDLLPLVVQALDTLLTARLGAGHNLQNLVINGRQLEITLLVPAR
jgi:hypothetical protein